MYAGRVVSWFSRSLHHCVTLSTTKKSEHVALFKVTRELMLLKQVRHSSSLVARRVQKTIFDDNDGDIKRWLIALDTPTVLHSISAIFEPYPIIQAQIFLDISYNENLE